MILNRAKDYYKNDKERLREQARDKYKNWKAMKSKNIEKTDIKYVWRKEIKIKRIWRKLPWGYKIKTTNF